MADSDFELPVHCYSCGAFLQGGATRHTPDCAFRKMVEESFAKQQAVGQKKNAYWHVKKIAAAIGGVIKEGLVRWLVPALV